MFLVRKNVGSYTSCLGATSFQVKKKVIVEVHSGIYKTMLNKLDICWVCLSGQMIDLRPIARVFEEDVILSVETNCSLDLAGTSFEK